MIPIEQIETVVTKALDEQPVVDMHTHLYPPTFGEMMLWGVDELLTYHYLVAEVFRVVPATKLSYEDFWRMTKSQQADHIWKHLFVERSPISEACRGVLTTLQKLGLDTTSRDLDSHRKYFAQQKPNDYIDRVMQIANVSSITMTNNVFDEQERAQWLANPKVGTDPRFKAVLRIDPMLRDLPAARKLVGPTVDSARAFLREWLDRTNAIYVAVSLSPEWRYPAVNDEGQTMLEQVVLPICAERGLPFAMMIGSRRQTNPELREAGDTSGVADVSSVANLCRAFPNNKFFVTMLARENQHELCVAARKFGNLMVFGCWWFVNNPSLIEEITRMRVELLGTSFIPQHSDTRILDQLVYKWSHSRAVIAKVLSEKYVGVARTGWNVTNEDIQRDVKLYLQGNFIDYLSK